MRPFSIAKGRLLDEKPVVADINNRNALFYCGTFICWSVFFGVTVADQSDEVYPATEWLVVATFLLYLLVMICTNGVVKLHKQELKLNRQRMVLVLLLSICAVVFTSLSLSWKKKHNKSDSICDLILKITMLFSLMFITANQNIMISEIETLFRVIKPKHKVRIRDSVVIDTEQVSLEDAASRFDLIVNTYRELEKIQSFMKVELITNIIVLFVTYLAIALRREDIVKAYTLVTFIVFNYLVIMIGSSFKIYIYNREINKLETEDNVDTNLMVELFWWRPSTELYLTGSVSLTVALISLIYNKLCEFVGDCECTLCCNSTYAVLLYAHNSSTIHHRALFIIQMKVVQWTRILLIIAIAIKV